MKELITVKVAQKINAPAEQVFDAWLQPAAVQRWLRAALHSMGLSGEITRVDIEPWVGGKFVFSDQREQGEAVHWGTYRALDRPHKIVFTWFTSEEDEKDDSSVVAINLSQAYEECSVTISHEMDEKYAEYIPQTENGWGTMLTQIAELLERSK